MSPSFEHCAERVLKSWSAYQYAITSGLGGQYNTEKAKWFEAELCQYFLSNKDLEEDEVVQWISEVVFNEFDLILEDGSLESTSRLLLRCFRLIGERNQVELLNVLDSLPSEQVVKAAVEKSRVETKEESDSCSDEEGDISETLPSASNTDVSLATTESPVVNGASYDQTLMDADGWISVSHKRKK